MHHEVRLGLKDNSVVPMGTSYVSLERGLDIGDTVSFGGTDGATIKIELVNAKTGENATPFSEPGFTITDSEKAFHVHNQGLFCFRCFLRPKDSSTFIGWANTPDGQRSGVEVPVPRPGVAPS
ncbi:MAG TPA: hypothetical protein VFY05_04495 [Candidatus Angelobacter sp.]|nr:hypothetical protein [Candidatus Angelobacter sp.]